MKLSSEVIESCKDDKLKKVLLRLKDLNQYYSLLDGGLLPYTKAYDVLGKMPFQLKEWLKIFDGGHLFFISMLTTRENVEGLDYPTFQETNSESYKKQNNITILQPDRWEKILTRVLEEARKNNLSEELVERVFKAIHQASIDRQTDIMNE